MPMATEGGRVVQCGYCDSEHLAYELGSDRGRVVRCIPCLAIEQGQQKLRLPLDSYDALDDDLLVSGYESARDWYRILARIQQDEPILKRDSEDFGTVNENLRTFLTNIMGQDAHYPPSEVAGSDLAVGQMTFGEVDDSE
jgi:hypothetical protein